MRTIEISQETFDRLAKYATGFDTPENVINRLLDTQEVELSQRPELTFKPESEELFKQELIRIKHAKVELYKADGTKEEGEWNARTINQTSSLRSNLWSGYLRNWKEKGIIRAVFTIKENKNGIDVKRSAIYKNFKINQLDTGTITVYNAGEIVDTVMPVLRVIAQEIGVSPVNSNGNDRNTRQLGLLIIEKLS
ncbi:hypothetical protein [Pectobacterium sp. A5351]|uniref:hypothetical protein n=1 Tax=Pectobacterium sp. A5351 TaxID=2914983 RepID=UPI002330906D|nr:hypothetical protein [Pectobacterium sp. A5351]WCG82475.1 hypothetical protein O1Q74_16480 [Pectobacterium sp. A5351]